MDKSFHLLAAIVFVVARLAIATGANASIA